MKLQEVIVYPQDLTRFHQTCLQMGILLLKLRSVIWYMFEFDGTVYMIYTATLLVVFLYSLSSFAGGDIPTENISA